MVVVLVVPMVLAAVAASVVVDRGVFYSN